MSQPGADEVKSAASLFPDNYVPVANFADTGQSSKLAVLDHLLGAIRREGQKVVVVSNYIQTLDMIETFLQSRGYQWLRLDGQTTAAERPVIVDRFNATYASEHFVSVDTRSCRNAMRMIENRATTDAVSSLLSPAPGSC